SDSAATIAANQKKQTDTGSQTAENTKQTADNTNPSAAPTGTAAGPQTREEKIAALNAKIAQETAHITVLENEIEEAFQRRDKVRQQQLQQELKDAQAQLDKDKKALADLEDTGPTGTQRAILERRLEFTIQKYSEALVKDRARGDAQAVAED